MHQLFTCRIWDNVKSWFPYQVKQFRSGDRFFGVDPKHDINRYVSPIGLVKIYVYVSLKSALWFFKHKKQHISFILGWFGERFHCKTTEVEKSWHNMRSFPMIRNNQLFLKSDSFNHWAMFVNSRYLSLHNKSKVFLMKIISSWNKTWKRGSRQYRKDMLDCDQWIFYQTIWICLINENNFW